jgi:hypothetical protein
MVIGGAGYHAPSRTLQVFAELSTSSIGEYNTASISWNDGADWADAYRGDHMSSDDEREVVFKAFSIQTAAGLYHYQLRARVLHGFFVFDGTLKAGDIRMYVTGPGSPAFSFLEELYEWPQTNADPVNTGSNDIFSWRPSATTPIRIEGSAPDGGHAWWMVVSMGLRFGGTNNPSVLEFQDMWRSIDGFQWEKVSDLDTSPDLKNYREMFESTTGRILLAGNLQAAYTDDGPSLEGSTWTLSAGQLGQFLVPMFGGTWVGARSGSLIADGFVSISCDDGAVFNNIGVESPVIPSPGSVGILLKLGPTEVLLITNGFTNPTTETVSYYSSDGGETWVSSGVWNESVIGDNLRDAFIRHSGTPLVVTRNAIFTNDERARGVAGVRTICPLANAGLAAARPLILCGGVLSNICEDH